MGLNLVSGDRASFVDGDRLHEDPGLGEGPRDRGGQPLRAGGDRDLEIRLLHETPAGEPPTLLTREK